MTRMILARTWFECGDYQRALDAISETGYTKLETTSGYSYTLYMQTLAIRGREYRKEKEIRRMSLICQSVIAMSLDLLQQQSAMEAYDQLAAAVSQAPSLIDPIVVEWAEEGLYRGTLLALSDRYIYIILQSVCNMTRN